MTRDRLLEQAIELLAIADFHSLTLKEERNQVVREGIELLRQPKPDQNELQEPVCPDCKAKVLYECVACSSNNYPPQRTEPLIGCVNHDCAKCKPLTDEQRQELMSKAWNKWLSNKDDGRLFAWYFSFEVEAAHGIKENT